MTRYAHASNKLLGIQIDAAINPGKHGCFSTYLKLQLSVNPALALPFDSALLHAISVQSSLALAYVTFDPNL